MQFKSKIELPSPKKVTKGNNSIHVLDGIAENKFNFVVKKKVSPNIRNSIKIANNVVNHIDSKANTNTDKIGIYFKELWLSLKGI